MEKCVQKLEGRDTYTPTDASQVCGSVTMPLNREETLSEHSLKTLSNNSEVNQHQHTGGLNDKFVYVTNKNGEPLMPCRPAKARHLLKNSKAKVVERTPFTIQLLWNCEKNVQPVKLGIDAGYSTIGFSAVTEKRELISGKVELRKDVSKKLTERRMYRRNRRNRLWHRKTRFDNRKKPESWLAPSLKHKLQTHIHLIEKLKQILPITKTIIEVANFDQQRMQNPEITGVEYQQGELQGYEIREYLLEKWGRKCAYCGKKNIPLEVEHIVSKARGGSDRVSNLTIACHKCNEKKGTLTAEEFGHPEIQKKAKQSLKAAAFMNIVRKRLAQKINAIETYGYITKHNRIKQGLEKNHVNDAFVIAGGSNQERKLSSTVTQTRRNNRSIQMNRKGFKPSIRKQKYKMQPNDLVKFKGKQSMVKGIFNYGKWVRLVNSTEETLNAKTGDVELIKYGKGLCFGY